MRRAAAAASDCSMRCGGTAWPTDSKPAICPACWLSSRDSGEAKSGAIGILWLESGATVLDMGANAGCYRLFPPPRTAPGKSQFPAQPPISGV
jgi:hypothetical protein